MKRLAAIILILAALTFSADAAIINVPDDAQTIQQGVNSAEDEDTVLVQPGTYVENVSIRNAITLASLILTTGDRAYIDSTIIDGGGSASVITSSYNGNEPLTIAGFTIQRGRNQNYPGGGGVSASSGKIVLRDLLVRDNTSVYYGGGIFAGGQPALERVVVAENSSSYYGGGIYLYNSSPASLKEVVIRDNESQYYGGGIYLYPMDRVSLEKVQVTHNTGAYGGGGIYIYSYQYTTTISNCTIADNESHGQAAVSSNYGAYQVILSNTILRNGGDEISLSGQSDLTVSYCDIRGGREKVTAGGDLNWGDGNIDADPLFAAADAGDYHIVWGSPCIDAGDPDSPLDPDSTRADIGANSYPHKFGILRGYVYDSLNNQPLAGATVNVSYNSGTETAADGYWVLPRAIAEITFNLTASRPGFVDSTLADLVINPDDTVDIDFSLHHPIFAPSQERISETVEPDSILPVDFSVVNPGNYQLSWSARRVAVPEPGWLDLMDTIEVGAQAHDRRIGGVVFGENQYFATGGSPEEGDENWVYIFNRDGEYQNRFRQFGESRFGMMDLAWDGGLIWGSGEQEVFGFTADGELVSRWEGPFHSTQALAWDSGMRVLWQASIIGNEIIGTNRNGIELARLDQHNFYIFGMDYYPDDPDGYPLYILHIPDHIHSVIHKMNPATGDTMFVTTLPLADGVTARAMHISNDWQRFTWVMLTVTENDEVVVWHLKSEPTWLTFDPQAGEIAAGGWQLFDMRLSAARLDSGVFDASLRFDLPEIHNLVEVPVTMRVEPNGIADFGFRILDFGLGEARPNPFNAVAVIGYQLSVVSSVELRLYDISGRLVQEIDEGWQGAGEHRAVINGEGLASGVYVLKLTAGRDAAVRKVVCVK